MENGIFNSVIGIEIKKLREARNMTQSELGALMNINAQNISSYERGERCPSMFWMHRLYVALEVDPSAFIEVLYRELAKQG